MTWAPLLLADRSPCLRYLVLRELLGRDAADPEVQELRAERERDPLVVDLVARQAADGSWSSIEPPATGDGKRITELALWRLGWLGFNSAFPSVAQGAAYLFARQQEDGSWPLGAHEEEDEDYAMVPLQTALPLQSLAQCGYAQDARCERAYDWLNARQLPDGAWPAGITSGVYRYIAGYRRLPRSQWGCRTNTTAALVCLALHPQRSRSESARSALDQLLGRETREVQNLGFDVARTIGAESARGYFTYYARFDAAQVLDLCWRVGASLADERVSDLAAFVEAEANACGLWTYANRPQASHWVTFTILRVLSRLAPETDWLSLAPRPPFSPYPPIARRF